MRRVVLTLLAGLLLFLGACQKTQKVGDGIQNGKLVVDIASAGIASLITDEYQLFIARENLALHGTAVLFEVELNGIVVGNLGNGEKAAYPVEPGSHQLVIRNRGPDGSWTNIKGTQKITIRDESKHFIIAPAMGWTTGRIKIKEVNSNIWKRF